MKEFIDKYMTKEIVFCTWCDDESIVEVIEEACPSCNKTGHLAWYNGVPQEIEEY